MDELLIGSVLASTLRVTTPLLHALAGGEHRATIVSAERHSATVRLDEFEGPFDLLLSLIAKHKLDITEVALSQVTDEFIAHVKNLGGAWDLEQTTSFLVVAAIYWIMVEVLAYAQRHLEIYLNKAHAR